MTEGQRKYIKAMQILMELFNLIIIVSAFYRMYLYQAAFGYTYLRIFVFFILTWEFILMIAVIANTLGIKINILKTGIILGTTLYLVLNYINIDGVIARKNIDVFFENNQKDIDYFYLEYTTGTDAIPEMVRLLDSNSELIKMKVKGYLIAQKMELQLEEKWQGINLSKIRAREILNSIKLEENHGNNR